MTRWCVHRIVSYSKERLAHHTERLLVYEFLTAYKQLRAECPKGDLKITLSVEETS